MSRNRDFYTDILNAERAEDATEDFDYDTYDDLSDDDLVNKIKSDHGYEDDELDDMYNKWDTESSSDKIDVDSDGNSDATIIDEDGDGDTDVAIIEKGKGSDTAEGAAKTIMAGEDEDEDEDDDKETIDSTGTVSDTDDDDWEDVKNALTSIKY